MLLWDGSCCATTSSWLLTVLGAPQDFAISRHDGGWIQFHVGLWNRGGLGNPIELKPMLQQASPYRLHVCCLPLSGLHA